MKKVLKCIVLLIMSMSLTGCMKYNIHMIVNKDMTSETSMELLVDDSFLSAMNMTSDEFYESFEEEYADSESLKDATISQVSDDGWSGVSISGLSLEDSISSISEEEIDGKDSIVVTISLNDIKNTMDLSSYGYSLDDLKEAGMEIVLDVTMPSDATSNIGEVNEHTVTIDLLELMYSDSDEENIIISSSIPDNTLIYMAIGGVAVIALIAGVCLYRHRKKQNPIDDLK